MDLNGIAPVMFSTPYSASNCTTRIELRFSCQNLVNLDTLSKSDPMIVVYLEQNAKWVEIGRTEMIKDNLNPKFVKSVLVDYHFETIQKMKIVCYDIDDPKKPLEKQDFIGEIQCKLSDIVTSRDQKFVRELRLESKTRGTLTIIFEEVSEMGQQVILQFNGRNLDKKDFFGKSDPFLVIMRSVEGNDWVPVCKTEVIKKTLDPQWNQLTVSVQALCNGDYDRPLLIDCYDWNRSGSHELIGNFKTTLRELLSGDRKEFELINSKLMSKKHYKNSGVIQLRRAELQKIHSFLDYIIGGCEISLIVAIDFTASNGNPRYTNSLHYMNPYQPNSYVQAIQSVGPILAEYDFDKNFPVYGFGAKIPPQRQVSHCFPLNGNWNNPEVPGVQGILDVYLKTLTNVELYGPTLFSHILRAASSIASSHNSQNDQKFYILLIITDGVINDMDESINEIVKSSDLPLSIIIIGVGDADFSSMEVLDADDQPLRDSNGRYSKRDIVQFVPLNKFKNAPPEVLSREVLHEVPSQLLSFMKSRGYVPNPPSYYRHQQPYPPQQQQQGPTAFYQSGVPPSSQQQQPQPGNYPDLHLNPQQPPGY